MFELILLERLELEKVTLTFEQALEEFNKIKKEKYSNEILLNGFVILQKFQDKIMWNISYATKSLQILNVKIDATNKEIISDQMINFIQQNAG